MQSSTPVQTETSTLVHRLYLSNYGVVRLEVDVVIGLGIEGIKDRLSRLRPVSENGMVRIDERKAHLFNTNPFKARISLRNSSSSVF